MEKNIIEQDRITDLSTVFREDVEQDVDLVVQDKLVKAGITEEVVVAMREAAQAVMKPVESEADMKALQKVLTPIVAMRTRIKAICKKGREHSNMVSKAWIAKEKEYVALVATVEDPLTAYKEAWKAEQERIKAEEEAEAKRILQARYAELEGIGMVRRTATIDAPERYEIGPVMFPVDRIDTADLGAWMHMTDTAKAEAAKINAARAEAEAKAKEEADRLAAAQAELDRKAKELADQEAAMQARIAAMNAKVEEGRTNEVKAIGANGMESPMRPYAQYGDDDWTAKMEALKVTVEARKVKEAEAAARAEEERKANEERIRAEAVEAERVRVEAAERAAIAVAAERKARMNDQQKWSVWIETIKGTAPAMNSAAGKNAVARVLAGLDKMTNEINNAQ